MAPYGCGADGETTPPDACKAPVTAPVAPEPVLEIQKLTPTVSFVSSCPFGTDSETSVAVPALRPGVSNACTTLPVVRLTTCALTPMPRTAKPDQISATSAADRPAAVAAAMIESRP